MSHSVSLHIAGAWRPGGGPLREIFDPATEEVIGTFASADRADLDAALAAAAAGFAAWRAVPAYERGRLMRRAADLMRARADDIAAVMTREHGKPLAEAKGEVTGSADMFDWFAEEARRTYGRLVPARIPGVQQIGRQGAGRSGRCLHAVEFSHRAGRPQGRRARSRPAAR